MRVIYFCTSPSPGAHAGGVKVIYDHCNALNRMGVASAVLHERRGYKYPWASDAAPTIDCSAVLQTDHIVVPEIKAASVAPELIARGLSYSIFVQNGYYLHERDRGTSEADIDAAYRNATRILSISSDTSAQIAMCYPDLVPVVQQVSCSIDAALFKPAATKERLITFMPRKNGAHANAVAFALQRRLPLGWRLEAIDGRTERQVAATLQRSCMFLSFSGLEGLGLPPIEAALCGNYVLGYHGGGGLEYWQSPNFEAVPMGDLGTFVTKALDRVHRLESNGGYSLEPLLPGIQALRSKFSTANEQATLRRFVDAIGLRGHSSPSPRVAAPLRLQRRPKITSLLRTALLS